MFDLRVFKVSGLALLLGSLSLSLVSCSSGVAESASSQDRELIAQASQEEANELGASWLWQMVEPAEVLRILALSPDGKSLVYEGVSYSTSGEAELNLKGYLAQRGQGITPLGEKEGLLLAEAVYSPDGKSLALSGYGDSPIYLLDLESKELKSWFDNPKGLPLVALNFTPKGQGLTFKLSQGPAGQELWLGDLESSPKRVASYPGLGLVLKRSPQSCQETLNQIPKMMEYESKELILPYSGKALLRQGYCGDDQELGHSHGGSDIPGPLDLDFYSGELGEEESGVDEGDPVLAALDGTVIYSEGHYSECVGAPSYQNKANYLIIRHRLQNQNPHTLVATIYWHLREVGVHPGQVVKAGQVIGSVGCTGQSWYPVLHFGARISFSPEELTYYGTPMRPEPVSGHQDLQEGVVY